MVHDRCNYFSFQAIFYPFTPLTAQKIKIFKKWKKYLEISSFYISAPKIMIRWCTVPEIRCVTDVIVISYFGLFFEKNAWKYRHFTYVYQKLWSDDVRFLRYGAWQKDGQTERLMDRWKKWHIEVGAPPKNKLENDLFGKTIAKILSCS